MSARDVREVAREWMAADPDASTASALKKLLETLGAENEKELVDCFTGSLEFGTAGLRGILGPGPNRMNRAVVRRTTVGLARYLKANVPDVSTRGVVIGRDGRRLSLELAEDTARVFCAEGIPVWVFPDVVPTPVTAFATLHLRAAAAVMVTASHNPPEYNGYKVYWGNGAQIVPPHDTGIAAEIARAEPANKVALADEKKARADKLWRDVPPEVPEAYLEAILALRLHPQKGSPLKIVYTAMHGVGGRWADEAMKRAGFPHWHVVSEQHQPDGAFPTVRFPNPEEPGAMDLSKALGERVHADLVLANDPDADRLAVIVRAPQGNWVPLSGNEVGVLLGHYVLTQTQPLPKKPYVVTTIVSSTQLGAIARDLGAEYDETLTGFKWIANRALEREPKDGLTFLMGYEEALGYTVGTVTRDKDGVGSAVVFADLAAWCHQRGTTVLGYLEEIQRTHGLFFSEQRNFTFLGPAGKQTISGIMSAFRRSPPAKIGPQTVQACRDYQSRESVVAGVRKPLELPASDVIAYELEGGGRVTLRPSGTEPKIKYYFELKEELQPDETVAAARTRAQERLGVIIEAFLQLARERGQS